MLNLFLVYMMMRMMMIIKEFLGQMPFQISPKVSAESHPGGQSIIQATE